MRVPFGRNQHFFNLSKNCRIIMWEGHALSHSLLSPCYCLRDISNYSTLHVFKAVSLWNEFLPWNRVGFLWENRRELPRWEVSEEVRGHQPPGRTGYWCPRWLRPGRPIGELLELGDDGLEAPPVLVLYCTVLYCTVLYCTCLGTGPSRTPGRGSSPVMTSLWCCSAGPGPSHSGWCSRWN